MIHPIQTALCSFGMSGHLFHAPFIHASPKFNLYGVMERSLNLAQGKYPKNSQVADYFDVKLFYDNHVVSLKSSYFVREPLPAYILHGTKGSFIKTKSDIQEAELQKEKSPDSDNWGFESDDDKGLLHVLKDGKFQKEYITSERGNYMEYYDGIYESLRNNKPLPVTATEAMQVILVIEAAIKSNIEKRVIDL